MIIATIYTYIYTTVYWRFFSSWGLLPVFCIYFMLHTVYLVYCYVSLPVQDRIQYIQIIVQNIYSTAWYLHPTIKILIGIVVVLDDYVLRYIHIRAGSIKY